ncbi:hypothetical protein [Thermalbibacter longus]|nr:hypothetical protein [Thermalbibacter longus]
MAPGWAEGKRFTPEAALELQWVEPGAFDWFRHEGAAASGFRGT